jgi:hypothetical protein
MLIAPPGHAAFALSVCRSAGTIADPMLDPSQTHADVALHARLGIGPSALS